MDQKGDAVSFAPMCSAVPTIVFQHQAGAQNMDWKGVLRPVPLRVPLGQQWFFNTKQGQRIRSEGVLRTNNLPAMLFQHQAWAQHMDQKGAAPAAAVTVLEKVAGTLFWLQPLQKCCVSVVDRLWSAEAPAEGETVSGSVVGTSCRSGCGGNTFEECCSSGAPAAERAPRSLAGMSSLRLAETAPWSAAETMVRSVAGMLWKRYGPSSSRIIAQEHDRHVLLL